MPTKSEEIQGELPDNESIRTKATKPLLAALLRIASLLEPEALPTTRWVWIVAGVIVLFGPVIGGSFRLSQRGLAIATAGLAPPANALAKPIPARAERPRFFITQASSGNTHL